MKTVTRFTRRWLGHAGRPASVLLVLLLLLAPGPAAQAAQDAAPGFQSAAPIAVTVMSVGYEKWGRPAGMDNPAQGCGSFNDGRPTLKFNIALSIRNVSQQTMDNWYARVLKSTGGDAYVCYYALDNGFPDVKPGETVNIMFAAFMEPNETAAMIVVEDKEVGKSDTFVVTGGLSNPKAAPKNAVSKPSSKVKPTATPKAAATKRSIALSVKSQGYERWGRPAGMDDPAAGCGAFNDARPTNKFNVAAHVTNNTSQTLMRWYLKVNLNTGGKAYVCYYAYGDGLPNLKPGESADVMFAAFMELNERAMSAVVIDDDLGKSNEVAFP